MKRFQLLLVTITAFIGQISAQKLLTPADFYAILDSSEIMYEVRDLDEYIEPLDYSKNINTDMVYRESTNDAFSIKEFNIPLQAQEAFMRAEKLFNDNKPTEARKLYKLTLELAPNFYRAYLHWANILHAKVLNRNNPRIHASLKRILAINHMRYEDWQFNPQVKIDSLSEKHVRIATKTEWMPYAMVEAAYTYDPAFVTLKKEFPLNRTKEDVLALSIMLGEEKTIEKHPEFIALAKALEQKSFEDYIYYELLLIKYPKLAYYLTKKGRDGIIKYVEETRLKKIE